MDIHIQRVVIRWQLFIKLDSVSSLSAIVWLTSDVNLDRKSVLIYFCVIFSYNLVELGFYWVKTVKSMLRSYNSRVPGVSQIKVSTHH